MKERMVGIECSSSGRGRWCWVKRRYGESQAESREKSGLWPAWRRKAEGLSEALDVSCCAREAILGVCQPGEQAVAATLSGQWGGDWAVTGKCCRRILEKTDPGWCLETTWGEGRLLACWAMVCAAVSCSPSEGTAPLLTEQLTTMAASPGREEGRGLGMPPPANSLLQPFLSLAPLPSVYFSLAAPAHVACPHFTLGRRTWPLPGQGLASWKEAEVQSLEKTGNHLRPGNTTRKKVLKLPQVARAWEETWIPHTRGTC